MDRLIHKYAHKLVDAGLASAGAPLIGLLDAGTVWNRSADEIPVLERAFHALSINSVLFCQPAEPIATMMGYLAGGETDTIFPADTETRTFIHDLPVAAGLTADAVIEALGRRKCLIVPGRGIVTCGNVSPEQACVVFSSVCFALFVKFFSDILADARRGTLEDRAHRALEQVDRMPVPSSGVGETPLRQGPFTEPAAVYRAMAEVGRRTVSLGLVDSFFGNISYRCGDTIYISQTGSSLDELAGCIDPCPVDGSSCAAVTASSELSAHRDIMARTGNRAVLHAHPRFSVIMSMDCTEDACPDRGDCHRRCRKPRDVNGVPVVSGEVGTGRFGLCRTVPAAMENADGVIVYGHGVFTVGRDDFRDALATLQRIEETSRTAYFNTLDGLLA
jgi:ribulose-5-phosphate 4-epimerase/fuculose-1-phosphate aldolase